MTNFNFTGSAAAGITNGYCSLQQYKDYQRIVSTDATDDGFINLDIEGASRWIDTESNTTFYGSTETDYYDVPYNKVGSYPYAVPFASMTLNAIAVISFHKYLLSLTTLTNGDGSVLTSSDYYLLPYNETPKTAMGLYPSANKSWLPNSVGELLRQISVLGVFGYAASAPADIVVACLEITKALYSRRFGENMTTKTVITSAGLVQIPEGVPDMAAQTIAKYRMRVIG